MTPPPTAPWHCGRPIRHEPTSPLIEGNLEFTMEQLSLRGSPSSKIEIWRINFARDKFIY
jgi:hypothetical protein